MGAWSSLFIVALSLVPTFARAGLCAPLFGSRPPALVDVVTAALANSQSPYRTRAFHAEFSGHPEKVHALLRRWYGVEAEPLVEFAKKELKPAQTSLLLDPGVVARFTELKPLLATEATRASDAYELRARLEARLGTLRIYRGVTLTESQFRRVEREGLRAMATYQPMVLAKVLEATYAAGNPAGALPHASSPLGELQLRHDQEHLQNSSWMSVSLHKAVAESAGYWYSGTLASTPRRGAELSRERGAVARLFGGSARKRGAVRLKDRDLYVFEFEVSPLDIVPMKGVFRRDENEYQIYSTYQGMTGSEVGPAIRAVEAELFAPYILTNPVKVEKVREEPDFIRPSGMRPGPDGVNDTPTFLQKKSEAASGF